MARRIRIVEKTGHVMPLLKIEQAAIRFAIARYGGQMSEVARRLKIGRSTLYRKVDEMRGRV